MEDDHVFFLIDFIEKKVIFFSVIKTRIFIYLNVHLNYLFFFFFYLITVSQSKITQLSSLIA